MPSCTAGITGIDAKDDKTFTMHFDKLTFDYAAINDFVVLPAHIERPAFADPAQYRVQTRYATDPTNPGLYNGPYRISEVATGSHIVLEPNPHWAGPPVPFRRITVRTIENTAALEANLLSGTIDMIAGELGLSLDEALAFEKRHGGAFQIIYKPGLVFEHIDLNLDLPAPVRSQGSPGIAAGARSRGDQPLAVRRAPAGRRQLYEPARSRVQRRDAALSARPAARRGAARRGRMEAAIRRTARQRRGTGVVPRADDNRRKPHARAGRAGVAEPVAQDRSRCALKNEPARVLFGETMRHRRFELAMYAWISASRKRAALDLCTRSEIPSEANGFAGQNTPGFRNAEADRLIDALEIELDPEKRQGMWAELQRLYATELPSLPLYFRSDSFILPKWLKGVRPTGNQSPSTLWITEWSVQQ